VSFIPRTLLVRTFLLLSLVILATVGIWAALLGSGDVAAYTIVCVLSGLALGADLALPAAILADHIALTKAQEAASRLYSIMTFVSKAALALATGLVLPVLGLLGYVPGTLPDTATAMLLSLAYAALPCALKLVTLVWLLRCLSTLDHATASNLAPARQRHENI